MGVKLVAGPAPGQKLGKVIYACVICKTETERRYTDSKRTGS